MTDGPPVADVLEERPDLEAALEDILAVEEETADGDAWTFEDVPVDSGAFGELVSTDVVQSEGEGYRVAEPEAVRAVLEGADAGQRPAREEDSGSGVALPVPDWNGRAVGLLAAALAVVAGWRLLTWGAVFRDGRVVLSGNDPYYYRHWVEGLLSGRIEGDLLGQLPDAVAHGEPLLVATLGWSAKLLGGAAAGGSVLAVYPVVAGVLVAFLCYRVTQRLTQDRRVAVAAVVLLAITPGHALRTGLGFADHHAFDYVWGAVVVAGLVGIATRDGRAWRSDPGLWRGASVLAVGVAGQTLAWEAGPLLLAPLLGYAAVAVALDRREGRFPLAAEVPLLAGLVGGATLAVLAHLLLGWHTWAVTAAPVVLVAGAGLFVALGAVAHRLSVSGRALVASEVAVGVAGLAGLALLAPGVWAEFLSGVGRLLRGGNIAEVRSLFSTGTFGFLLLFGFLLVLAVPALVWASVRARRGERGWLVVATFGWYLFVLSILQVRFVGHFAFQTAILGGLALVWLAAKVDLAVLPAPLGDGTDHRTWLPGRPDRATVGAVLALFLLVGGIGMVQTAIKVQTVTIDDSAVETADFLEEYAGERGWDARSEAYVFSRWGLNRMYNYVVTGEAESYGYAQRNYEGFLSTGNPDAMYDDLDGRVRFVVLQDVPNASATTTQTTLFGHFGSRHGATAGSGHYRGIFVSEDGRRTAFQLVEGARLVGSARANHTVGLSADVRIDERTVTYARRTRTNATGGYAVTVAYPGEYTVGNRTVTVPLEAVESGSTVRVN